MPSFTTHHQVIRIAIFRTSSLGDVVLASACLDYIKNLPIPVEVTWIGRGISLNILSQSWPKLSTIELPKTNPNREDALVFASLKECNVLIDLQNNLRSRWFCQRMKHIYDVPFFIIPKSQISRSRLILEARVRGRRRPLPEKSRSAERFQFKIMVDTLKRALRYCLPSESWHLLENENYRPALPVSDSYDPPWRKELRFGIWLAIAPGAAHATKEAPLDTFADTILEVKRQIAQLEEFEVTPHYQLGLVFLGDEKDRTKARLLLERLQWAGPVLNLCGKLTFWESAVALREVVCLLSNDSSLGHVAEAVDTPSVVFFGPTVESFGFAPRMSQSRAFSSPIGCRPCSKHGKKSCRYGDKLCFTTISFTKAAKHLVHLMLPALQKAQDGNLAKLPDSNQIYGHIPES